MTSSEIKLKILLLSPSETEKANLLNLLYFWSRNEDIITCLQQRRGIMKSRYIDGYVSEESKLEAQKQQQPLKIYNFKIEDVAKNKRFEIELVDDDAKQFKQGQDVKEIQSFLAKKRNMDGVLVALKGSEFEEIFKSPKNFEDYKKRNPQLFALINEKELGPELKDDVKDVFCFKNEIFDVDPKFLLKDSGKQMEIIQMNQRAKESLLGIFRKLWENALKIYEDHKAVMKKGLIRRKFCIVDPDKRNRVKRIKSLSILPYWISSLKEKFTLMEFKKRYQPSLERRMCLEIPGNPIKVSEAKMLRKGFAGCKSVQNLVFVWPYTYGSSSQCSEIVYRGLGKLSLLKRFSLRYNLLSKENNDLENIETSLKRFKRLESFSLSLSGIANIKKEDLENFQRGLKRLKSLKEVDIDFNGAYNSMNNSRMAEICLGLSKFSHLKSLKLLMHGSGGLDSNGMELLCETLSLHTGLQRLFLDFSGTSVMNQGFQTLYRVLKKLPYLKSLTLLFVRADTISNDSFKEFCQCLQGLRDLEELDLNFSYCPLLTRESLRYLRDSFKSLADVQRASLLFIWCKQISIDDVKDLKRSLLELRSFKSLIART